ncbi:MAG: Mov34/MPN/PAD-1 family protein [Dehalococcoidia bacterium]
MRRVTLRQTTLDLLPTDRELGAALCEMPDGSLAAGPVSEGTMSNVDIPLSCPAGGKVFGTWHTHPQGVANPSPQDWEMLRRHGLRKLCITQTPTGETRCWPA